MNYKLRIKHPSGAEFEAEGPADFIISEKEGFLSRLTQAKTATPQVSMQQETAETEAAWDSLAETRNGLTTLKNKHPGLRAGEAALILLAIERQAKNSLELSAITLSKAVKASGYAPERLDRILTKPMREGLVKASGTKRNRAYQITDKGLERAWLEARKLGS